MADCADVWPENVEVWRLWCELSSQWQLVVGSAGSALTAPRAADVEATLRLLGVKRRKRLRLFDEYRGMRDAALEALAAPR